MNTSPRMIVDADFPDLFDDMKTMRERINNDPRTLALIDEFLGCLNEAGYPNMKTFGDLDEMTRKKWRELNGWTDWSQHPPGVKLDPSIDVSKNDKINASAEQVAQFRNEEIAAALARFDCAEPLYGKSYVIELEYKTAFVEHHRAWLEQYRDAITAAEGN